MNEHVNLRDFKRLMAAEGYLELGMPAHALEELQGIEDAGPMEGARHLLIGEAYKAQEKFGEAIAPLRRATELFPAPHNKQAWLSLSECYRRRGQAVLALLAQGAAHASGLVGDDLPPGTKLQVTVTLTAPAPPIDLPDRNSLPDEL